MDSLGTGQGSSLDMRCNGVTLIGDYFRLIPYSPVQSCTPGAQFLSFISAFEMAIFAGQASEEENKWNIKILPSNESGIWGGNGSSGVFEVFLAIKERRYLHTSAWAKHTASSDNLH